MNLSEILSDSFMYPLQNLKALLIYVILGIILGIALGGTVLGVLTGAAFENVYAIIGSSIIGIIVAIFLGLVIVGYELDIIKYGIERNQSGPEIDFVRQFINGVKFFVVDIVYFIIPVIIGAILAVIFQHWLSSLITAILFVVFSFAAFMAQCRLAKTEDLGYALAIGDAIGDISRVGFVKLLAFIVCIVIIESIIFLIIGYLTQWNSTVGGILGGILGVYITFFIARATGLLYSDV